MANTITVNSVSKARTQFQGAFGEMWRVKATVADQDAVAIGDTLAVTLAVPGVALGDMVVGQSISVDLLDAGGDGIVMTCAVSAADVVTVYIHADVAEFAADALNTGVIRVLIGRPLW